MRHRSRIAARNIVTAAAFLGAVSIGADPARGQDAPPAAPKLDRQLDPRIAPEKVGERELPRLPEQVVLPLPATHRIATAPSEVPIDAASWRAARQAIERGLVFLRGEQDASGGWMTEASARPTGTGDPGATTAPPTAPPTGPPTGPPTPVTIAVTALAVKAMVQSGAGTGADDAAARGLAFILATREADGSFSTGAMANYVTSTVVSALAGIDELAGSAELTGGIEWLQRGQWDDTEGLGPRQDWYGGAGYGKHGRPDLSNTQMMLEALYDAGLSPDEPAFQRALAFVTRAQNFGPTNDAGWVGDDGGFIYTPAGGGESMASEYAGEGRRGEKLPAGTPRSLRSYGSMTYAGFKSLLYAGLSPEDERVRAAFDWVRRHWTFEENPGLGSQGLYYYYHALARALRVAQQHRITDLDGNAHNWREELIAALASRQRPDGSWANESDRWLEAEPVLATTYALLALEEALKPAADFGD